MNALVILGHPHKGSFNHAIANKCVVTLKDMGFNTIFHDLYCEKFNPVIDYSEICDKANIMKDIEQYCDEIMHTDILIFIHPNWWGQPPAILKGWIDRVLRAGLTYKFQEGDNGEGVPIGLLQCKTAFVFNTSNTKKEREQEVFGDPLQRIWEDCILKFCGVHTVYRNMFETIVTSSDEERSNWLDEVRDTLRNHIKPCI